MPSMFLLLLWTWCFVAPSVAQNSTFARGQKFQIVLQGVPDMLNILRSTTDAAMWDVDLFDSPASTVQALKAIGKTVICYFSAGTAEDWRDDYKDFAAADLGKVLPECT